MEYICNPTARSMLLHASLLSIHQQQQQQQQQQQSASPEQLFQLFSAISSLYGAEVCSNPYYSIFGVNDYDMVNGDANTVLP